MNNNGQRSSDGGGGVLGALFLGFIFCVLFPPVGYVLIFGGLILAFMLGVRDLFHGTASSLAGLAALVVLLVLALVVIGIRSAVADPSVHLDDWLEPTLWLAGAAVIVTSIVAVGWRNNRPPVEDIPARFPNMPPMDLEDELAWEEQHTALEEAAELKATQPTLLEEIAELEAKADYYRKLIKSGPSAVPLPA